MNGAQKQFLDNLVCLLEKYSIDSVYVKDGKIAFESNGSELSFASYRDGTFTSIATTIPKWQPGVDE